MILKIKIANNMKSITRFLGLVLFSITLFSCGEEKVSELEDKESTVTVMGYKDEEGNLQWVRTDNAEQIEILPSNDSIALPDSMKDEGVSIEFVGNFYKQKQPFVLKGDTFMYKTLSYKSYKLLGKKAGADMDNVITSASVLPFSQIDSTNFFQSFAAYVQNGNIKDMIYFFDSAYIQRRCVRELSNDTAKCMNDQYCGEYLKGAENGQTRGCLDFNEIENIEFIGTTTEMDEPVANFKISTESKVIKIKFFYVKRSNGKRKSYALIGN